MIDSWLNQVGDDILQQDGGLLLLQAQSGDTTTPEAHCRLASIACRRLPWFRRFQPLPDNDMTQGDRQQLALSYACLLAGEQVTPTDEPDEVGGAFRRDQVGRAWRRRLMGKGFRRGQAGRGLRRKET